MNALHEDLLVKQENGGKDRVEKSPVRDLFGGMYRSTVTCEECHSESTVYEPFVTLPLPVPERETKKLRVTFFPLQGGPINYGVRVNKSGNANHLFTRLAEQLKIQKVEGKRGIACF